MHEFEYAGLAVQALKVDDDRSTSREGGDALSQRGPPLDVLHPCFCRGVAEGSLEPDDTQLVNRCLLQQPCAGFVRPALEQLAEVGMMRELLAGCVVRQPVCSQMDAKRSGHERAGGVLAIQTHFQVPRGSKFVRSLDQPASETPFANTDWTGQMHATGRSFFRHVLELSPEELALRGPTANGHAAQSHQADSRSDRRRLGRAANTPIGWERRDRSPHDLGVAVEE